MAAPAVQTLAQVMADLNPAYSGQEAVNQQQQAAVPAKYDAQRSALTAEKGQGFNAINNQATGRGMSFSGIPLDEQATYLSTKYLPGMQAANAQQNADQLSLQGDAAKLATEKANNAMGIVQKQQSDLNSWNMQQDQLAATARENALNRAAQASEAAASRAAQAQSNYISPFAVASSIFNNPGAQGKDNFVSPNTFNQARLAYIEAGGSAEDFQNKFRIYAGVDKGQTNYNWAKQYGY